jgi:hypothetical protein
VTTPAGQGTLERGFTYREAPALTADPEPGQGSKAGGYPVRVTGLRLAGATRVRFEASPEAWADAPEFTVTDDSTVICTAPAVDISLNWSCYVRVTTPHGTSPTGGWGQFVYLAGEQGS